MPSCVAACALLLGVIGLYGVIAYSANAPAKLASAWPRSATLLDRPTHPREAASLILLGLAFGIAASILTGRLLRSLLFGVHSWDLSILAAVSVTLASATLIAAWSPARRAAATDPMQALRSE